MQAQPYPSHKQFLNVFSVAAWALITLSPWQACSNHIKNHHGSPSLYPPVHPLPLSLYVLLCLGILSQMICSITTDIS